MPCLTKEKILKANDIKMIKVPVPEWTENDPDAYIMVKSLTASEQDEFDKTILVEADVEEEKATTDLTNYRAKRAAFCMCDDNGNRLFTSEDIPNLAQKSSKALQRVLVADRELNGGDVGKQRKNLSTTLSDSLLSS
jgi:hypothetical protein